MKAPLNLVVTLSHAFIRYMCVLLYLNFWPLIKKSYKRKETGLHPQLDDPLPYKIMYTNIVPM